MKPIRIFTLLALGGILVGTGVYLRHEAFTSRPEPRNIVRFSTPPSTSPAAPSPEPESEAGALIPLPISPTPQVQPQPQPNTPVGKTQGKPSNPPQDPLARVALALVGIDPEAEAYWIEAINDPNLSDHEREDLIEDLNEDGLSDPRQASTPEDMQLVLNRIELIEEIAPYAMDQVNADAFAEAYKDLVNLASGGTAQ